MRVPAPTVIGAVEGGGARVRVAVVAGEEHHEVVSAVGAGAEQHEVVSAAGRWKRNSRPWSTTMLLLPAGSRSSASPCGSGSLW
jgi:hypothetical protein